MKKEFEIIHQRCRKCGKSFKIRLEIGVWCDVPLICKKCKRRDK